MPLKRVGVAFTLLAPPMEIIPMFPAQRRVHYGPKPLRLTLSPVLSNDVQRVK
jgi:hypothetical protein